MGNTSKHEIIDEMISEGYNYDSACRLVYGDSSCYDDSDSELDLLACADEAVAYNENYERYMAAMRQDFPKDFADDDPFTSTLLDWCEKTEDDE